MSPVGGGMEFVTGPDAGAMTAALSKNNDWTIAFVPVAVNVTFPLNKNRKTCMYPWLFGSYSEYDAVPLVEERATVKFLVEDK